MLSVYDFFFHEQIKIQHSISCIEIFVRKVQMATLKKNNYSDNINNFFFREIILNEFYLSLISKTDRFTLRFIVSKYIIFDIFVIFYPLAGIIRRVTKTPLTYSSDNGDNNGRQYCSIPRYLPVRHRGRKGRWFECVSRR